jgi:hypothetical protein
MRYRQAGNAVTVRRWCVRCLEYALREGHYACDCVGSSTIKRAAIPIAVCSGQMLVGMLAMLRAKLSVASDFGNPASLPASSHGSFPSRANTETRLRVIPFVSVPTGAKRNSFNPDCCKAKASELGILNFHNGMNANGISCIMVADATCPMPAIIVLDKIPADTAPKIIKEVAECVC